MARRIDLKKNVAYFETIVTQKCLVNFTNNYKEIASNTLN